MKRIVALLLTFVMCMSLCACGKNEEVFKEELYDLSNRLLEVKYNCEHVVEGTRIIWKNVGSDDFWNCYNAVRALTLDKTKDEYDALLGQNTYAVIWCAARGLCPSKINSRNEMTPEGLEETIDLCLDFNKSFSFIDENMDLVFEDVREFRVKYEKDYPKEVSTLNDWCIECGLYVDFALEPAGSYNSYVSTADEFEQKMNRFTKIMDSYY